MPTVLRVGSYKFYFYSHELGEPPHVHVDRAGFSAKFWLDKIELARNIGFAAHELAQIRRMIEEHHHQLMEAWNGYFGFGGG